MTGSVITCDNPVVSICSEDFPSSVVHIPNSTTPCQHQGNLQKMQAERSQVQEWLEETKTDLMEPCSFVAGEGSNR